MKEIAMMVGLPRSGKSTISKELKESNPGSIILCNDLIRLQLYGQRFYRGGEAFVWACHDLMFKLLLEQGVDIVLDETNVMAVRRAEYIKLAKQYGYRITCVWVKTDIDVCKERAVATMQDDLVSVVDQMAGKFNEPKKEEGFDDILIY
jgi:predicted kinase